MSQTPSSETSFDNPLDAKQASPHPLRKLIFNFLKIGVTGGILWYLWSNGLLDFSRVQSVLTNPTIVLSVFCFFIVAQILGVIRWQWLLDGQGLSLKFAEALRLTMIGVFFNTAIPGAVSGDLVKGYYIVRKQPSGRGRIKAFTTLLLDRLLGLSALVFVSFFAMIFNLNSIAGEPKLKALAYTITMLFAGVVVFYSFVLVKSPIGKWIQDLLPKLPVVGEMASKLFDAVKSYEEEKGLMLKGFAVSILIHLGIVTTFVMLARALGGFESVPLDKFYFIVPFGLLVTAIPIAPAGLGTGHLAFHGFFTLVGAERGADLFTAYVSFQIMMSLIGGLFYIRYRGHEKSL